MKKIIILVFTLVVALFFITGCQEGALTGKGGDPSGEKVNPDLTDEEESTAPKTSLSPKSLTGDVICEGVIRYLGVNKVSDAYLVNNEALEFPCNPNELYPCPEGTICGLANEGIAQFRCEHPDFSKSGDRCRSANECGSQTRGWECKTITIPDFKGGIVESEACLGKCESGVCV